MITLWLIEKLPDSFPKWLHYFTYQQYVSAQIAYILTNICHYLSLFNSSHPSGRKVLFHCDLFSYQVSALMLLHREVQFEYAHNHPGVAVVLLGLSFSDHTQQPNSSNWNDCLIVFQNTLGYRLLKLIQSNYGSFVGIVSEISDWCFDPRTPSCLIPYFSCKRIDLQFTVYFESFPTCLFPETSFSFSGFFHHALANEVSSFGKRLGAIDFSICFLPGIKALSLVSGGRNRNNGKFLSEWQFCSISWVFVEGKAQPRIFSVCLSSQPKSPVFFMHHTQLKSTFNQWG